MSQAQEISLGNNFGAVAVNVNGLRLDVAADGKSLRIAAESPVAVSFSASAAAPAPEATPIQKPVAIGEQKPLEIGDKSKDGWIYAGLSEDRESPKYNEPLWAAPEDAGVMSWNAADKIAAGRRKEDGRERLPTRIELNQLFTALANKGLGGFDTSGAEPGVWYWASGHTWGYADCQEFYSGVQDYDNRRHRSSVRFVR